MKNEIVTKESLMLKLFGDSNNPVVKRISEMMPEIQRASNTAGRSSTQFVGKNLSLFILGRTPFSIMRQCLSKIEHKVQALQEARFKHSKDKVQIEILKRSLEEEKDELKKKLIQIDIDEIICRINSSVIYIQGALKDIAQHQSVYDQVRKTANIPDTWDEVDYEKAEAEHHLKQAFLQGLRDYISNGRIGQGESEYFENVGVHPLVGLKEIMEHAVDTGRRVDSGENVTSNDLESWLNTMAKKYKDAPLMYLSYWGIEPVDTWYVWKDRNLELD